MLERESSGEFKERLGCLRGRVQGSLRASEESR